MSNNDNDKIVSTSQALLLNLKENKSSPKRPEAAPDSFDTSQQFKTTTSKIRERISKPKRKSAYKGQGNLMGLYIYTLLKKFPNCKFGSSQIMDAILTAIKDPDDPDDEDFGDGAKNIGRICDNLSAVFSGEDMKNTIMPGLIKDVHGGEIKKDDKTSKHLFYYSDPQSPVPESDYVTDDEEVLSMMNKEFDKVFDKVYPPYFP